MKRIQHLGRRLGDRMSAARERAGALLERQREVLRAAWSARHELAGPKRLSEESAFLPAALAVQDTPMHPAPRRTAFVLMGMAALALAWACLGRVDIVAIAPGRLVVNDRSKIVQPLERSVVTRVLVRDGDRVTAGQTLVELDPTAAAADHEALTQQRHAAQAQALRARALLAASRELETPAMNAPDAPDALSAPWPAGWSETFTRDAADQLDAEWRDLRARLARIDAERARREAERATADAAVAKLETALPLAHQREADLRRLSGEGFVATHGWQDRRRERLDLEGDLATQQARRDEADTALAETQRSREMTLAEARRRWHEALAEASQRLQQLDAEQRKTARRDALTRLTAPVDGVVQQLAVHTVGGVVSEAQPLLVVVPDDAPVTAEVMIENLDIGFVREGDEAAIKLEAFPYTRHGTLPATVTRISRDAIDDEQRGPRFSATLTLKDATMDVDGQRVALRPGMTLTAEVRTGRRRVISFLLSPLEKRTSESLRER